MAWASYQKSFFDRMFPLAQNASEKTGIPADVIFAQSALESNWGRSAPQNNYFGIKGGGGTQTTREFINGAWVTVRDAFRGYSSMSDSVDGYVSFINNPNSRRWTSAKNSSTSEEAARALQSGGYATDPNYANKLMAIVRNIPSELRTVATGAVNSVPEFTPPFTDANSSIGGGLANLPKVLSFEEMAELARQGNILSGIGNAVSNAVENTKEAVKEANPMSGLLDFFKNLFSKNTAIRLIVVVIGLLLIAAALAALAAPQIASLQSKVLKGI